MAQPKDQSQSTSKKTKPQAKQLSERELAERLIDEALKDSFPASDPPCWTLGRERASEEETQEESNNTKTE